MKSSGVKSEKLKLTAAVKKNLGINQHLQMLAKILTSLKPLQVSRKEIVCIAGDIGREMYILIHGEMIVEDVTGKVVTTLKQGDYVGELSALDINPINLTTVTATQNCELYSLSKERLQTAFATMPEVLNHMREIVLEKLIVLYKLDANADRENETLNTFLETQTKKAIDYKNGVDTTAGPKTGQKVAASERERSR